jgi:ergothioneine biosynthesis protein EgtB
MQFGKSKQLSVGGLSERFLKTRKRTLELCEPLETEDFIPQPAVDVSPTRWNIAHTTWFFEEMVLKRFKEGYAEVDPEYCFLFNSYYNTVGERTLRHKRGDLSRPTVAQIFEYRKYVDTQMATFLKEELSEEIRNLVELGVNHEQQHQELLLTDLKYTFSVNPVDVVYHAGSALVEQAADETGGLLSFEEGIYEIGHNGSGFCFDNELARHKVYLSRFDIESALVTNEDYIEFILDGGYQDHRLWHSEGWDWIREGNISMPLYWSRQEDGSFYNYTLAGTREVARAKPVCHVSFYEAAAFAEWKGKRLPTEFEWEAASGSFKWGARWEWTSSAYLPYPGFSIAEGAVGEYNGKFMVNQKVLRGGSCATPIGHSRPTYRNFFHPQLRWQFTGIRLAS